VHGENIKIIIITETHETYVRAYSVSECPITQPLPLIVNQTVKERDVSLFLSSEPNSNHHNALLSGDKKGS
jgi:hypothetical protein